MMDRQNKTVLKSLPADLSGDNNEILQHLLEERHAKPANLILNAAGILRIDQMGLALLDDIATQQKRMGLDFSIINVSAAMRLRLAPAWLSSTTMQAVA